jgi:ABC-type branched-subunit amino acid transport system ATPase component
VFEVRDLAVRPDLRGVTLRLYRGDVAVVHGPGASSVVRAAAGIVRPTTGVVRLHGDELTGLSPQAVAALGVAYVGPAAVPYPDLTVVENLVVGAASGAPHGREERADAVLAALPRLRRVLRTGGAGLDGVDAAVLTVGVALARRPRLLLLDGLAERVGEAYDEVRAALRIAAADEVVSLVAEPVAPADVAEYDASFELVRGWVRPS